MPGSDDNRWIVTAPRRRGALYAKAAKTAERLGLPYVERGEDSFATIFERTGAIAAFVETEDFPLIQTQAGQLFFHENTAGRRTTHPGRTDALLRALETRPDDRILDATVGLACDALVIATSLDSGKITGVESNPLLADLVSRGLKEYTFKKTHLESAADKIEIVHADHVEFMRTLGDGEYDLIYFDPMFTETVSASPMMQRVRALADKTQLSEEALREAARVARRRVVVKGRRGCFGPFNFPRIIQSGRTVFYGIIDV
ncbi:MAG: class I SAM-dependent methyltransferase [bacterium]